MNDKDIISLKSNIDNNVCWICFKFIEDTVQSTKSSFKEIVSCISSCFKILVEVENSNSVYNLCKKCSDELGIANFFRLKILNRNEKLNQKVNIYIDNCYNDNTSGTCKDTSYVSTSNTNYLNKTSKIVDTNKSHKYTCKICPYSTPHSQTLVNHMRRHSGDRPYKCYCGKSFTQSSSLSAHSKTHTNVTSFTCSLCGKQFKHSFALKNHSRVHSVGKYSCNICQKLLKSERSLQEHLQRHYNIKNYNCEDCGDTFVTSSELFNHKKIHNEEKEVKCNFCSYTTKAKKNLIIHLKRHAGDKNFKCHQCEMTFYTNGDLQRHIRVHSRDKPFMCPTCTQRFTHSSSLNKHMLTLHGVHYKWCDIKRKQQKNTE